MRNSLIIITGKLLSNFIKLFNLGNGSTWPGHIALSINKNFIKDLISKSEITIILVAGTNGKTTTGSLITHILRASDMSVVQNKSGANLLNGIASALLLNANIQGKVMAKAAVFEIDENILPGVLRELTPDYIVLLNIFRDQLDRYGEVNSIAKKWKTAISQLTNFTTLLLNADDPQIAYLAKNVKAKVLYFGLKQQLSDVSIHHYEKTQQAADSIYCPNCEHKLNFKKIFFSHLGEWECLNCDFQRPKKIVTKSMFYPLLGVYNYYNTHAAIALAQALNIDDDTINNALHSFKPVFGRQEKIEKNGKTIQFFLSKNPTSFNQSLRTIQELNGKTVLIILNDQIPDGRDVSWIWDIDIEQLINSNMQIFISGDRAYDMGLRLKYAYPSKLQILPARRIPAKNYKFQTESDLKKAIKIALEQTSKSETLYILPTYSAMLESREILTGKKIL